MRPQSLQVPAGGTSKRHSAAPGHGTNFYGLTPLQHAVAAGRTSSTAALLSNGVAVDARDPQGRTALHSAAESGQHAAVAALLAAGTALASQDILTSPRHFTAR